MMTQMIDRVCQIYERIDTAVKNSPALACKCSACGKCCSFESFGHRLYITPPELDYLAFHVGKENIRPMKNGVCPFNENGKCFVYDYRFASCRIFCCTGDKDFQSQLTESTLTELKQLCVEFELPYSYRQLSEVLPETNRESSIKHRVSIHPPAEVCDPVGHKD